ncbi:unnamed protein product [marine sediment metagenome]|uniref:Uncharacterized protein n=1 Tax=marine sediment metagenome TaxID=412755 RepID=X1KPQ1_9ZZZZ
MQIKRRYLLLVLALVGTTSTIAMAQLYIEMNTAIPLSSEGPAILLTDLEDVQVTILSGLTLYIGEKGLQKFNLVNVYPGDLTVMLNITAISDGYTWGTDVFGIAPNGSGLVPIDFNTEILIPEGEYILCSKSITNVDAEIGEDGTADIHIIVEAT